MFFDMSSFISMFMQVVQFSFMNSIMMFDRNVVNYWRVSLEDMFNVFVVGNFMNSECRVQIVVMNSDNYVFECLQMFFGIFNNLYFYFYGIIWMEGRYVLFYLFLFKLFNNVVYNLIFYFG